jgi:hypothetical protein
MLVFHIQKLLIFGRGSENHFEIIKDPGPLASTCQMMVCKLTNFMIVQQLEHRTAPNMYYKQQV